MNFEDELRAALRREPAPAGFAENVLAKTKGVAAQRMNRRFPAFALAAALVLAGLIPWGASEYHRRQFQRGMEAKQQLDAALGITRARLQHAKEKLRSNTRHIL